MSKEEMIETLAELEGLVAEAQQSTTTLSLGSIRKALKNIPRIIDLSFKLTKAVIEKLNEIEDKI